MYKLAEFDIYNGMKQLIVGITNIITAIEEDEICEHEIKSDDMSMLMFYAILIKIRPDIEINIYDSQIIMNYDYYSIYITFDSGHIYFEVE